MITLRADNRILTANAKFAYLVQNYPSASAILQLTNTEPFTADSPILIGEWGHSEAEVLLIDTLDTSTGEITLIDSSNVSTQTSYAHPESTRTTALPFDQVRFFWTAATGTIVDENPVFDENNPLTGWVALDPSSYYSTFADANHSTGFGWFEYMNSVTSEVSQPSNPIPYAGFTGNTAAQIFADFESLLNTNELKLVTTNDKFSWLNEALSVFKNKLNLTNMEYTMSAPQTITTIAGTAEYLLPDDFADLSEIVDNSGIAVGYIPAPEVLGFNGRNPVTSKYYLRGRYIGFAPTPTQTGSIYHYTYRAKASRVTNLSTYIDLPDNAWYSLKDWMMFRAYSKFNNPLASSYYQSFTNAMNLYIQSAVKRSANLDTWEIASNANA